MNAARHAALASALLRAPGQAAERCRDARDLSALVATSLAAIGVGSAAFGAVVGSFRGGAQIAFAALKVPVAMLLALALCVPAFVALAAVFGRAWPLRTVVALALASAARASLLLLAFTPALWLAYDLGLGYHGAALAAAIAYAVAGAGGLGVLARGLGPGRGRWLTLASFGLVFLAAAGQTSWALRPYLVRPQTQEAPFVREPESSFVEAMWLVSRSAAGIYDRDLRREPSPRVPGGLP